MEKSPAKNKSYTLRFAKGNLTTFNHIKAGRKTVETRAGTVRYISIHKGDTLILSCAGKKIKKTVKKVTHFKTITALLKKYNPSLINPGVTTQKGMEAMYYAYPGYKEKIKEFGILAFELV